jgi:hypothetical protein
VKGVRRIKTQLIEDLKTEDDIGSKMRKLKIKINGTDSLSIEHKKEIHILHKSMDLLISTILDNSNSRIKKYIHKEIILLWKRWLLSNSTRRISSFMSLKILKETYIN